MEKNNAHLDFRSTTQRSYNYPFLFKAKPSSVPFLSDQTKTTRISGLCEYAPPPKENSPMVCSDVTATKPDGANEPIRSHRANAAAKHEGEASVCLEIIHESSVGVTEHRDQFVGEATVIHIK